MRITDAAQGKPHQAGHYEIRLRGLFDAHQSDWFDGLTLTRESDTGLPLISVTPLDPNHPAT